MAQKSRLTRAQKAAAILVAMGKPAAGRLLKFFKQDELKALIEAARTLQTIPQAELDGIVSEFESEFAEGAGLLDSGDQMDTLLSESLSPEEVDALMGQGGDARGDEPPPIWPRLEQLEPARLGVMLASEHPQTIAFILGNLSSRQAASALLSFERPARSDIVKRMLTMSSVKPLARQMIEKQLQVRLSGESLARDSAQGETRVASVLREFDKDEMEAVMGDLEAAGLKNLEAVRAKLFAFEDLLQLSKKALVTLFDGLSTELVTLALRGAEPEIVESVLGSLGSRSRRMIEAELSMEADIAPDEIQRARKTISATVLDLAAEGRLELPAMDQAA